MASTLKLLLGPARVGKTERLLTRYADMIARHAGEVVLGRTLWLAPNRYAASDIRHRLVARLGCGCLAPGIETFASYADRLLHESGEPVQPISNVQKRWILRQICCQAAESKQLTNLDSLLESTGTLDAIAGQIRELKRLEIWPEHFEQALVSDSGGKVRDLLTIYSAYQDLLNQHQWYDAEGRFWTARNLLRSAANAGRLTLDLVIVDGFTDFTRPQHEMLQVLAHQAGKCFISLLWDDDFTSIDKILGSQDRTATKPSPAVLPLRSDVYSKPIATLRQLQQRHDGISIETIDRDNAKLTGPSWAIGRMFRPPSTLCNVAAVADHTRDPKPRIIELQCASQVHELREVARRIKRRVLDGTTGLADVLVVLPQLPQRMSMVEEVFGEYGIPINIDATSPIGKQPLLRRLLLLLRLRSYDWAFDDLLAVIRDGGIDWVLAGDASAADVRIAAERALRRFQLPRGCRALLRRFDRLIAKNRDGEKDENDDASARGIPALTRAATSLGELAVALSALPKTTTQEDWTAALETLTNRFLFSSHIDAADETVTADRATWHRIKAALLSVVQIEQQRTTSTQEWGIEQLAACLEDIAASEPALAGQTVQGGLRVVSPIAARSIHAQHVYFAGLGEFDMPNPQQGEAYFTEAEVGRLRESGLPLVGANRRYEEEMLLFCEVASQASETLVVSYAARDDKAQPLLPSPFLSELLAVAGEDVQHVDATDFSPVRRGEPPLNVRELRTAAVSEALGSGEDENNASRLNNLVAAEFSQGAGPAILAGLRVVHARSQRDGFGPSEGRFDGQEAIAHVARQFGSKHCWSPTALESYAYCPYRFFAERVLDIEPLEELQLATDFRRRGQLVHQWLAELFGQIGNPDEPKAHSTPLDADQILASAQAFVQRMQAAASSDEVQRSLLDLDLGQLEQIARAFPSQVDAYGEKNAQWRNPPTPAHFEVRFGPAKREVHEGNLDPLTTDEPFELQLENETILITGQIDRIDVGTVGDTKVFNIIDYKTGKRDPQATNAIDVGHRLQFALYAMAAENLLLKDIAALPWQSDYWWLRDKGFGTSKEPFAMHAVEDDKLVETPHWKNTQAALLGRIEATVQGVRSGQFAVDSEDDHCKQRCPYANICRIGQIRALGKSRELKVQSPK